MPKSARLFLIILILFFATTLSAGDCKFNIKFHNNTDHVAIYRFKWIDHPFNYPRPYFMAMGELQPGESNDLTEQYKCGLYWVEWDFGDDDYVYAFSHQTNEKRVVFADMDL